MANPATDLWIASERMRGRSLAAIGAELGLTREAIRLRLKKVGVSNVTAHMSRYAGSKPSGIDLAKIGAQFDVNGFIAIDLGKTTSLKTVPHSYMQLVCSLREPETAENKATMDRLTRFFGGGVSKRLWLSVEGEVGCWQWRVYGARAWRFLDAIRPHVVLQAHHIEIAEQFEAMRLSSHRKTPSQLTKMRKLKEEMFMHNRDYRNTDPIFIGTSTEPPVILGGPPKDASVGNGTNGAAKPESETKAEVKDSPSLSEIALGLASKIEAIERVQAENISLRARVAELEDICGEVGSRAEENVRTLRDRVDLLEQFRAGVATLLGSVK